LLLVPASARDPIPPSILSWRHSFPPCAIGQAHDRVVTARSHHPTTQRLHLYAFRYVPPSDSSKPQLTPCTLPILIEEAKGWEALRFIALQDGRHCFICSHLGQPLSCSWGGRRIALTHTASSQTRTRRRTTSPTRPREQIELKTRRYPIPYSCRTTINRRIPRDWVTNSRLFEPPFFPDDVVGVHASPALR
jgi:hypothetical protein